MSTTKHQKSIHVDAPVEKVFDHVQDPAHFLAAMPLRKHETSVLEWVNTVPEGVGTTYRWTGHEFGIKLSGVITREEYVANERIVDRSSTGPVWTWTLEPDESGTTLTLGYEYSTRVPLADKVIDKVVWNADEDLTAMLATIKAGVET